MYKINAIAEEFEVIEEYEGDDSHVEHKIVVKVLEHKQILKVVYAWRRPTISRYAA
jgi:hypothetical protein